MSKRLFKTMVALLAIAAAATGPARAQSTSQVTDVMNREWTGRSGPSYGDWSGLALTSDAVYAGQTAGGNNAIQMRSNNQNSGIVTTTSGGTVASVTVTWNSNTPSGRTLEVYGKHSAYSSASDLYGDNAGDLLGSIVYGTSTPLTIEGDYEYIGLRSMSGAMYLDEIQVVWNVAGSATPEPPAPAVLHTVRMAEGTEEAANWSFTPAEAATNTGVTEGTVVTVKYNGTRRINSIELKSKMLATPLTIEALTAGNVKVQSPKNGMKYKKNNEDTVVLGTSTTTINVVAGDKVAFYGDGTTITTYQGTYITGGTAEVKVYGNIMSLVNEEHFDTATTLTAIRAFYCLFRENATLSDASGLLLPATTLTERCYMSMFENCENLAAAPVLPATTLTSNCYAYMFLGCTSLTTAPELPAPVLAPMCYYNMFRDCSNLNSVTCLATDISASSCTRNWLNGAGSLVTGTKTFNAASSATWPTDDDSGIPSGWTRQVIGAQSTPEPVTLVPTGNTNEWTLTMPADNMLLMVNYAPAHTVRFADGNNGWQVQDVTAATSAVAPAVLENVIAGDSLVVTAPTTLPGKVKSVKAVKYVAPAATVTTEPTATAAYIEANSTTALVNAGAANGGTMMYKVTTTNAQPASTDGFSTSIPTAEGRTAGTYYVWYYAKADADHSDSEIAGPVSVTLAVMTTVTINQSDWGTSGKSFTKDGVTVSVGSIDRGSGNLMAGGTFSTTLGKFTRIVVTTGSCEASGTGWSGSYSSMTWAGTPASTVSFSGNFMGMGMVQTTFVCTIVPTN